jgi:acetyltransferase-like isoleucine patch superfamily enzyme
MLKMLMLAMVALLPQRIKHWVLNTFFGFDIDRTAFIGMSILNIEYLKLAANARIGHLNVFKGLKKVEIREHSSIGNLNWVTGFPVSSTGHFAHVQERVPSLLLGEHSAITNRHLIDCTASFSMGKFTTFAGFRSQVLTHSIDLKSCRQDAQPIKIGDYCFVGTNCILLPGSILPSRSVLAANSVLINNALQNELVLYGGNPAIKIKELNKEKYKYFDRTIGFVI